MTDVRIRQTVDGGEIESINGIIAMDGGLESSIYLSLFGGNEQDSGGDNLSNSWWGNGLETDPDRQYRSKTQYLLRSIPSVTSNLVRIKNAVEEDIAWAIDDGLLEDVVVSVGVPGLNQVYIRIDSTVGKFEYVEFWEPIT